MTTEIHRGTSGTTRLAPRPGESGGESGGVGVGGGESGGESVRFADAFRKTHVGASQVAQAIGASPFGTPISLWEKYMGLRTWDDGFGDGDHEATDLGHLLEPVIIDWAASALGVVVQHEPPMQTHPRMPWLVASRDAVIVGTDIPIEVKTTAIARPAWKEAKERWGFADEGAEGIPIYVAAQVQVQLLVARACADTNPPDHAYVAALIGGGDPARRLYLVPYDDELARSIVSQASRFWRHVTDAVPPPPDGSEDFKRYLNARLSAMTRTEEWITGHDDLGTAIVEARNAKALADERYETLKQRAQQIIGNGPGLRGDWGSVAQTMSEGKMSLNESALREQIAARFFAHIEDTHQRVSAAGDFIDTCRRRGKGFASVTVRGPSKSKRK